MVPRVSSAAAVLCWRGPYALVVIGDWSKCIVVATDVEDGAGLRDLIAVIEERSKSEVANVVVPVVPLVAILELIDGDPCPRLYEAHECVHFKGAGVSA